MLLQATARPERRAAGPTPTASPLPAPLFDHRPGRTPIPAPAQTGDLLSGPLPVTGDPGPASATRAANLVLGRYCADPSRYGLTIEPYADGRSIDFHHLSVVVVDRVLTVIRIMPDDVLVSWTVELYRRRPPSDPGRLTVALVPLVCGRLALAQRARESGRSPGRT